MTNFLTTSGSSNVTRQDSSVISNMLLAVKPTLDLQSLMTVSFARSEEEDRARSF